MYKSGWGWRVELDLRLDSLERNCWSLDNSTGSHSQSDGCVGGCRLDETACNNILLAIGPHAWPQSGWVGDHRLDSMWQHAARHRQHALTRTQTDGWVGDHRLDSMWQHTVCHWTAQSQSGGCVDDLRLEWQYAAIHWTTQGHSEMDVLMTSD